MIRNLENGRLRILVNCNNAFAVLHAGQMLNGSRNTNCNVKLRRNNLEQKRGKKEEG